MYVSNDKGYKYGMDASKVNLSGVFQDTVGNPRDKVKYYVGWLNRFLQFYNGGAEDISGMP
jgi:hypothetical protein